MRLCFIYIFDVIENYIYYEILSIRGIKMMKITDKGIEFTERRSLKTLKDEEQKVVDQLFAFKDADDQTGLAKALIREAAEYLSKEDHVEMGKWFIDSIADFPSS